MVWVLIDLPPNCKTVGIKWIFKKKTEMDVIVHTYKAYLVAKGYTQLYEVDYKETFSHITDIREAKLRVDCYCDAGFETDRDDTKSQIGYVFVLNGDADVAMEAVWIRKFISGLGIVPTINEPSRMFCNNSSVFHIANEPGV
uniref:Reverse transcriptase Ty1/copia-type domain-containing protein n=1 Tax=Tanacetum cinerariifolium TaxID=118510 RepID=A0A699IYT5_TANCI|nr:hypothetical protein [Tanacetum cinerariifolium]